MANNCYYEMKIKGARSNCEEWVKRMKRKGESNNFYRIFSVDVFEEGNCDDSYYMKLCGDCAWSLEHCCRTSGCPEVDLFCINTKELNLTMEAYSEECGYCFQEHYLYIKGKCVANECVDWFEYYWDKSEYKTFDEYKNDTDLSDDIDESRFDEDGYYYEGGFGEWSFFD